MTGLTSQVKRRTKDVAEQGDDLRSHAEAALGRGPASLRGELTDTFRASAIEVLKPVARTATTLAAKYAVSQGPRIVKGAAARRGGIADAVGGVASKLGRKKRASESPSGTGRGRRLPVQEFVDIGVDLQTAYDQFTQFEEWPRFMHRVERIEQRDDATLMWHENIWGVRRSWEVEITDQEPCERIVWRSRSGPQTIGVATFHGISDHLSRICVTADFQPKGFFEKAASGTRTTRRALRSDLMRFKAFLELRDEATGAWEGRIEHGEVVDEPDERPTPRPRRKARTGTRRRRTSTPTRRSAV